jgi:hypothetical protein
MNHLKTEFCCSVGSTQVFRHCNEEDRQCTCNVTLSRFCVTFIALEKQCVTYSACGSVALVIQHAMRMRHIVSSSMTSLYLPYFATAPLKRHDFRGKKTLLNLKCVVTFCTYLPEIFLILEEMSVIS